MDEQVETPGERLRRYRRARNQSQTELGVALGYEERAGQVLVSRWETGITPMTADDMEAVTAVMDLPPYALEPVGRIKRLAQWIEAAARQGVSLPQDSDPYAEIISRVEELFGTFPERDDQEGWSRYMDHFVRSMARTREGPT